MNAWMAGVLVAVSVLVAAHVPNGLTRGRTVDGGTVDRRYHPNGALAEERRYVRGVEEGRHRGWWPNGRRRFDYTYRRGVLEGQARDWFPSGQLYRDFHYAAGHEAGSQRMWFADGALRANYEMRGGRRYGLMGSKGCVTRDDSAGTARPDVPARRAP